MSISRKLRLLVCLLLSLWGGSAVADGDVSKELFLGVYAYREPAVIERQYQPLVDYLNANVKGFHIHLKVLNNEQLKRALRRHKVDLLLVNPSLYEIVRNENSLSGAIATIQHARDGKHTSSLGGVVFTQSDRQDIKQFKSLEHKTIAIPSTSNMGAYRIPLYELKNAGVDTKDIRFVSVGTNDDVVAKVLSGKVDAGFVRTGILESWQEEGKLKLDQIKVLHLRKLKGFPYLLSTSLYPEWPFVVLSSVEPDRTRQLIVALFNLKPGSETAKLTGISGFVPPLDYLPVQNLLRSLHLPPFDALPEFSWQSFWKAYHVPILLLVVLFIVIIMALLGTSALSATLKEQSKRLAGIIRATRSGSWEWDIPTGKLVLNDRWAEIIGYKLHELEPITIQTWEKFTHPEDLKKSNELIRKHFAGELDYYEMEVRLRHKDGRWVWVLDRGMVTRWSSKGEPLKMAGTHVDISNLKEHEALLKLNANRDEALLRLPQMMETSNEAGFLAHALDQIKEIVDSDFSFAHIIIPGNTAKDAHWTECSYPVCKTSIDQAFSEAFEEVSHQVVETGEVYSKEGGTSVVLPVKNASESIYIQRCVILPVFEHDKVVMVFGFGNKSEPYDETDLETIRILGDETWRLIENSRIQEQALQQHHQYQRLVNEIGDNFVVFSISADDNVIQYISDSVEQVFGLPKEKALGISWPEFVDWQEHSKVDALFTKQKMRQGDLDFKEFYMRFYHPITGEERIIKVMLHAVRDVHNNLIGTDGLIENVTEKLKAENDLKQAASVFEYAQEGIIITDANATILDVNDAFVRITGFERDEVIGQRPNILNSGRQSKNFYAELWKDLFLKGQWSGELWNRRKDGEEYPEKVTISAIYDEEGKPYQYIALFSDLSLQKQQQQQLEYIAHYDSLTGLPNRSLLSDRIGQAMAYSNRHGLKMAVVFIDLDGFKAVNDVYGHQTGDRLLVEIAKRFQLSLRESDTIARLGGDEFVAVISDFNKEEELQTVLERLLKDANKPVTIGTSKLGVSASIGVSFYQQSSDLDADQIMREADQAMYQAKLKGKNQIFIFEGTEQVAQSADLKALETALNNEELCLYYQPKVNMRTGEVLGFEALMRWNHPTKGLQLPGAFLPLLGDRPFGNKLGYWVIEQALKQMTAWLTESDKPISVSVNVEGHMLQDLSFITQMKKLLDKYPKVSAGQLTLEILESSAIEDVFSVSQIISECRKLGVYFSIDDFGTGYASLTYLKNLPVHELKIDRSFIKDLTSDLQSMSIMQSLASMGQAFNLKVIAEGVETDQQASMLLKLGYELAQGYRIARPMPVDHVLDWLNAWEVFPHWQSVEKMKDAKGLALVAVIAEHKTWVDMIKRYIESESKELPPLHPSECRFGRWLHGEGGEVLGNERDAIDQLHQQVHQSGEKAIALKQAGDDEGAVKELVQLEQLKVQIVNKIEELIKKRGGILDSQSKDE